MQISQFSKTASRCLVLCAAVLITTACTDYIEPFANPDLNGNNISLNTDKEWTTCQLPTFIGNISTLPADLQNVIRKRFPNTADRAGAKVIFVSAGDFISDSDTFAEEAANGAFIVTAVRGSLASSDDSDILPVLLRCYTGGRFERYYTLYDEPQVPAYQGEMTSSMSEDEWKELSRINKNLGEDGGVSPTDYDNDPEQNENYFNTRLDPFIEWIDMVERERSLQQPDSYSYDNLVMRIENEGQYLSFNYPFTLNEYIDKATGSEPDYLCKSGSITVEFRIHPVYMQSANGDKAGDYYAVVANVTPHNQSMWGPYVGEHGWCRNRIYGFWFSEMNVETSLVNADGSSIPGLSYYDRPIPENKNSSKTYSNGKTISISGTISGGYGQAQKLHGEGTFSLGGTWSSSTNYTLETINYSLDSSNPTVKYHYWSENVKLTDDWDDWGKINQNFPAPVRTEFSAHTAWIWHVPSAAVKDYDTKAFKLKTNINLTYGSWYHWRGAVEYDSNRKNHRVNIPEKSWLLEAPYRTPWGFIRLRNASNYEMAHVTFTRANYESGEPEILTTSYGKGEEARIALPEGTYDVTWDFIDGDTNVKIASYIYRNVKVHQGRDEDSSTLRISTVDGKIVE